MTDTTQAAALPDLLPCPFCGHASAPRVTTASQLWGEDHDEDEPFPHTETWQVMCDATHPGGPGGCGAGGGFKRSEEEAVQAWNHRPGTALQEAERERDALRADAAETALALEDLIAVGCGRLQHDFVSLCPDHMTGHESRDHDCMACKALIRAQTLINTACKEGAQHD